jgi:protein-disulfide isomerase
MSEDFTIKKSTFNKLIIGICSALIVAAFLGGYILGNFGETKNQTNSLPQMQVIPQPTQTQPVQPSANSRIFIPLGDSPTMGSPSAPVTMIEFSDFQCPFCGQYYTQTLPEVEKNYIDSGKVRFVFKNMPLDNLHPNARAAANGAECANEQNKFWKYHNKLFESQNSWAGLPGRNATDTFKQYAADLGLDSNAFNTCVDSGKYADKVNKDYQDGSNYGVSGTPTFFIGNDKRGYVKVVGAQPFSVFQQQLDSELSS